MIDSSDGLEVKLLTWDGPPMTVPLASSLPAVVSSFGEQPFVCQGVRSARALQEKRIVPIVLADSGLRNLLAFLRPLRFTFRLRLLSWA